MIGGVEGGGNRGGHGAPRERDVRFTDVRDVVLHSGGGTGAGSCGGIRRGKMGVGGKDRCIQELQKAQPAVGVARTPGVVPR